MNREPITLRNLLMSNESEAPRTKSIQCDVIIERERVSRAVLERSVAAQVVIDEEQTAIIFIRNTTTYLEI